MALGQGPLGQGSFAPAQNFEIRGGRFAAIWFRSGRLIGIYGLKSTHAHFAPTLTVAHLAATGKDGAN